jgi:plasmid stabilization system protein ParE
MAEIAWTAKAIADWEEIVAYVARASPERAGRLGERLMGAPEKLIHNPKMGRRVPEFDQEHIRELVFVRPYRILYRLQEDVCYVMAVIHSRRDLKRWITQGDLEQAE